MRRPYLVVFVLLACSSALSRAQETVEFSDGFEGGAFVTSPARSSETGIISSCSGATVGVSAAAARTGSYGAWLSVKAVCANWRLKLQTRDVALSSSRSYSLCMWARCNFTAKPFTPKIALSFYRYDGGGASTLIDAVQPRLTSSWAKYCYHIRKPPVAGTYFWNLNVGNAAANTTYHVDDVTLASEPNAQYEGWADSSAARIEQLRKGDFSVDLRYSDGTPVDAAAVSGLAVTMVKHDFPFAVAFSPENFAQSEAAQLAWYKAKAAELFSGLGPENAFKWPAYEPTKNNYVAGRALLQQFWDFAAASDFTYTRAHTVEWFLPDPEFTGHWSRKTGCANYTLNLKTRIERDVAALPPAVRSLDVFNEILDRRTYAETCNLFSGGPSSVVVSAFKWARAANPALRLCLNDYDLVSSNRWTNMVELVEWLVANGAPVGCIGVQSHLLPADIVPDDMAYRLHKLAALTGLPVEVTEISFLTAEDPVTWAPSMTDEAAQAAAFDQMLRTYFSHPDVSVAMLWGFVDTNHYIPNGGIFRADGTPKPAGAAVEQLIRGDWNSSSPALAVAPAGGSAFAFRGFYGTYRVSATIDGETYTAEQRAAFPAAAGAAQAAVVTLPAPPPAPAGGGRRMLRRHA